MTSRSGSSSDTRHFDADGREVFPCRCGETHTGDYAFEDWNHHNCFHTQPLLNIGGEDVPGYYMCGSCGQVFWLKDKMPDFDGDGVAQ